MKQQKLLAIVSLIVVACLSGCNGNGGPDIITIPKKPTAITENTLIEAARKELDTTPLIIGYYANWDIYKSQIPNADKRYMFTSPETKAKLARLNTVIYAFFGVSGSGSIKSVDYGSDFSNSDQDFCNQNPEICFGTPDAAGKSLNGAKGNFTAFAASGISDKVRNRLVAVGGIGHEDAIENALASPEEFAQSVKTLQNYFAITGIDLDYEPSGGMVSGNYPRFINLVKVLRKTMGKDFMITYTISANHYAIDAFGKDNWQELNKYISYVNILGNSMFGRSEQLTGLQSALYTVTGSGGSDIYSDDTAITQLNNNGIPFTKIVLGAAAYGRIVSHVSGDGLGQSFNDNGSYSGDLDDAKCSDNNSCFETITYDTIVASGLPTHDVTVHNTVLGSYSNFEQDGYGKLFISYDSPAAIRAKVAYSKEKSLAGITLWDINYDAPAIAGNGTENQKSLLNVIDRSYHITPQETVTS